VAQHQHLCQRPEGQGPGPRRPRVRRCLLKDCERDFVPDEPLSRYCGEACSAEARRWSQREANRRYRASEGGRRCRREQACRYRQRLRERRACAEITSEAAREGYHQPPAEKKSCCQRPGCYEPFSPTPRSPLQKFCSSLCRQALRRVLIRERRWRDYFTARAAVAGEQAATAQSRPALSDAYFRPRRW
jgi:hypothetical protein